MTLRDKLFSFDGRLRRSDWWVCWIGSSIAFVALASLVAAVTSGMVHTSTWYLNAKLGDPIERVLVAAALYAPFVLIHGALAAKRAHDRNHSARLVIILVLVAAAMSFLPDLAVLGRLADAGAVWAWPPLIAGVLAKLASLYLLVVLGFLDGTPGPNRFGPSPKGLSGGSPAFMAPGGVE